MSTPTRLAILGCTGSVGTQTLELVERFPERFQIVALIAGRDADKLAKQVVRWEPKLAGLAGLDEHEAFAAGASLLLDAAAHPDVDLVVNAVVGSRGLAPTLAALDAGHAVALANKESLVAGGPLVSRALKGERDRLRPVDSEHAALQQALRGVPMNEVSRLTITASGGPFRTRKDLSRVTVKEALAHPTWSMGARITIDSATLMNKGLELIEAHHLFGFGVDRLRAVVHPQSLVHAIVELVDGSQIWQASVPDMKLPIASALMPHDRQGLGVPDLDLERVGSLTFEPVDHERFPALGLALEALETGGTAPAVLNAADEEIVGGFLDGRVGFTDIAPMVRDVLSDVPVRDVESLEDVLAAEQDARTSARALIDTA